MGFADQMVRTVCRVFHEAEKTLRGFCVSVATHVFVGTVVDRLMPGKLFADVKILAAFVGHEGRLAVDVLDNKRAKWPVKYVKYILPCRSRSLEREDVR